MKQEILVKTHLKGIIFVHRQSVSVPVLYFELISLMEVI